MTQSTTVNFETLKTTFTQKLLSLAMATKAAERCAEIFAQNTIDGVLSHGVNRFPVFFRDCQTGVVSVQATASKVSQFGCIEQWDGHAGIGLLNAEQAMLGAVALAKHHGFGCVGLRNTNHWMRAGTYTALAAEQQCAAICWTNTVALMPAWGGKDKKIGNNPLSIGIPKKNGHVILDMAMSQYAFGKLEVLARLGETLPIPGGVDALGQLTQQPSEILNGGQALPIGYWKGSGLAVMLDLLAMMLSGGSSTREVTARPVETKVSQVFLAFDITKLGVSDEQIQAVIKDLQDSEPKNGNQSVMYPGENMLRTRERQMRDGVKISSKLWDSILRL